MEGGVEMGLSFERCEDEVGGRGEEVFGRQSGRWFGSLGELRRKRATWTATFMNLCEFLGK